MMGSALNPICYVISSSCGHVNPLASYKALKKESNVKRDPLLIVISLVFTLSSYMRCSIILVLEISSDPRLCFSNTDVIIKLKNNNNTDLN